MKKATNSFAYIIAEVGVNHNGNIEIAKELIKAASDAGANAVKFQTFQSENLVTKHASMAAYQKSNLGENQSQFEMLKKLELSFGDFKELKIFCDKLKIDFISTPFDHKSAECLKSLGVNSFKIGSGDLTNIPLLKLINSFGLPVILSTGMGTLSEIESALNAIADCEVSILHCTSAYPAKYEEINLLAMNTIHEAFKRSVGYSDHTLGIEISVAAVALGATIIEKHITLNRNMSGPDHKVSLEPKEFNKLVESIRNVEASFGDGIKRCQPSEEDTKKIARKSVVATKNIKQGEIINTGMVTVKRPGNGIKPEFINQVIGAKAIKNITSDTVLEWTDII